MESDERLANAQNFHGHLGPCLVLGLRLGDMIVRELGGQRYFGLQVTANCPPEPPPSCVLDGLQLSTGCTMGKRNLALDPGGMPISVRATSVESGKSVAAEARSDTYQEAVRRMKEHGEVPASVWYYGLSEDQLFTRTE